MADLSTAINKAFENVVKDLLVEEGNTLTKKPVAGSCSVNNFTDTTTKRALVKKKHDNPATYEVSSTVPGVISIKVESSNESIKSIEEKFHSIRDYLDAKFLPTPFIQRLDYSSLLMLLPKEP